MATRVERAERVERWEARAAKPEPCAGHAPLPASPAPAPASPCVPPALSAKSLAPTEPAVRVEPTTLSVLHWGRLLDGELFATSRYVQWAVLMKRTFRFDALRRPRCERKMRVLSTITDPKAVRRILDHLNPPSPPTAAVPDRPDRARPLAHWRA